MVLSLVVEDDVDLLGSRAADVGSKHNQVWSLTMHFLGVEVAVKQLDVTTAAVNVLFVLHGELEDQGLLLVREFWELGGQSVKVSVLAGLDSFIGETEGRKPVNF